MFKKIKKTYKQCGKWKCFGKRSYLSVKPKLWLPYDGKWLSMCRFSSSIFWFEFFSRRWMIEEACKCRFETRFQRGDGNYEVESK